MVARILDSVRRAPLIWWVGLFLLVGMGVTAGVRWYTVQSGLSDAGSHREAVVSDALDTIERRFGNLQEQVQHQAYALATDAAVEEGLRTWNDHGRRAPALVQRVLNVSLDERTTVEIYARGPKLLAWNGRGMPRGSDVDTESVPSRPQAAVVPVGDVREALVFWWPVRRNDEVFGAVRVVRTIAYEPPVQNRYIEGFRLRDVWAQETGETVRVDWSPSAPTQSTIPHRLLRGPYDSILGVARVIPPSPIQLLRRRVDIYDNLLTGWVVLLLGWVVVLVGRWYLRLARRTGVRRLPRARRAVAQRFACLATVWVGVRFALLNLDVPARWLSSVEPFGALFDPTRLASTIGGGLFRSIGDLFLTGGWVIVLAVGLLHLALRYRVRSDSWGLLPKRFVEAEPHRPSLLRFLITVGSGVGITLGSVLVLTRIVQRIVLDSTLDFFSRTGLLPEPLVAVVLCALVLVVAAVVLIGVAGLWIGARLAVRYRPAWPRGLVGGGTVVFLLLAGGGLYLVTGGQALVSGLYVLAFFAVIFAGALYGSVTPTGGRDVLTVRGLLFSVFVVTLLLYPLLYEGMDAQRRDRMAEAARSFAEGYDPRAVYSLRQDLRTADEELAPFLAGSSARNTPELDSVATEIVRRSLLTSLTTYELSLTVLTPEGSVRRRYTASGPQAAQAKVERGDRTAFNALRRTYERQLSPGPVIDRLSGGYGGGRIGAEFQYAGLLRAQSVGDAGWVLLRAMPRSLLPGTGSGVPRVLLPDGSFSDLYAEVSLAEFREGILVRSFGRGFERVQLPRAYQATLAQQGGTWREESVRNRQYLTYYTRSGSGGRTSTIGVRIPSILAFDHLYYLLRLTVAGLGVALVIYLMGLFGRYRRGRVPAPRIRFRDKVLNAFLIVGVVSMVAVGVVGMQVVTNENERVLDRRLHDHLTRVEETLALEARPEEPLWRVAERMDVDSLAARVGLDVQVYEEGHLIGTSQPRLIRDGLVDERLPGAVYHQLYGETHRFTTAAAAIGTFRYRVGYQTLVDDTGRPRIVIGVPTLAQQEQVAQEQARMLAYLFGALLVLVIMVMLTAVLLANALTQPIARLREGLEAVGEGRFARALPVETRDEIGDLVRTFNDMRAQLAESRRKLAQQERELAWREMARQVAHEIKNPLTPMKLSIQHLRRAFDRVTTGPGNDESFEALFDRITSTLVEQIESLVRIANEFSTFARLPTRVLETLDLNEVIREAVRLLNREGAPDRISLSLHPEPLLVEADREELRRTYINLLKNALQALPNEGDGTVLVTTGPEEGDSGPVVRSRVIDDGSGIPSDVRDKIFEPSFSTKTSGTGLGLAIAKKSIDELGGDIGYESEEGEGTTFWIRLPLVDESTRTEEQMGAEGSTREG